MSQIQNILMDVDGTMTDYFDPDNPAMMSLSPLAHLENLVMKKHSVSREEARRRIYACGDTAIQCLSEFLPALEIEPLDYFRVMAEDLRHFIFIPEDTVRFFHYLRKKEIKLYTASTNSPFMTLVKLSVGGIADEHSCPFLTGFYPGCMFKDPEGKYSAAYYPDILKHSGFDPEKVRGIGYNSVTTKYYMTADNTNICNGRTKLSSIRRASEILMFGDTGYASSKDGVVKVTAVSYCSPNGVGMGGSNKVGTVHFRHAKKANIGWCDGHVGTKNYLAGNYLNVGHFDPTNKYFDPNYTE